MGEHKAGCFGWPGCDGCLEDICSPWKRPDNRTVNKPAYKWPKHHATEEDKARLMAQQEGLCGVCEQPLTSTGLMKPQVDHDHATGRLRGLLCQQCNDRVGRYERSADQRARIESYLAR